MKVLMQSRKNFYTLRGGDTVQLLKTKAELEKLGVGVDISLDFEPDLSEYDLVHLSNVTRIQETYLQTKNAKAQGKPIVLSTIFWPMNEFEQRGQAGIRKFINKYLSIDSEEKIKALARYTKDVNARNEATKNLWKIGYTKMQQYVLNNVDFFLPNSQMEMDALCSYFSLSTDKYIVVPNAIDDKIAKEQLCKEPDEKYLKYKDYVICVGRIEPRKNQLALVQALNDTQYKLLLVGGVSDNQKSYFEKIKTYLDSNSNFDYIEKIDNNDIYALYRQCKVSTLPSWLDTPGLVSLEAGAMGCNLAISLKGSATEYFEDLAEYCLPDDLNSIRNAVERAFERQNDGQLQKRIFEKYTWQKAAEKTLEGYKNVLVSEND